MPTSTPDQSVSGHSPQRNFLIFVTDQNRWDFLGRASHSLIQTPNLDALAACGVRFDRHYTTYPLCMPTRSTMVTGLTARGHGTRCNGIPLDASLPTMTQTLADSGYRTHGIGKLHYRPFGTVRGVPRVPEAPHRLCHA
jgi:arylsulfatase A-like enzyme